MGYNGSNEREGWLDGDAPRTKTIRLRMKDKPGVLRDGDEIRLGNTVVRIRGRQAVREHEPTPEPRRDRPASPARPPQDLRSAMRLHAEKQRQQLKRHMMETFWMVWPFLIGGIGLMMFLTGIARMNPLLVVAGLFLGFLAWKGKTIADWFDAKEAERKAARADFDRKAVESEVERRLAAQEPRGDDDANP